MIRSRILGAPKHLRGFDRIQFARDTIALGLEVVSALQVDPIFGTGVEVFPELQGNGHSDALAALANAGNGAVGNA